MKEEEWRNLKRPYEVFPYGDNNDDGDYGWHITSCDECGEIIGFEQYPPDGDMLCVECGLKVAMGERLKK